MTTVGHIHKHL